MYHDILISTGLPKPTGEVKVSSDTLSHLKKWLSTDVRDRCLWLTCGDDQYRRELGRYLYHRWESKATTIAWESTPGSTSSDIESVCQSLSNVLEAKAERFSGLPADVNTSGHTFETTIARLSTAFDSSRGPVVGIFPSVDSIRATPLEISRFLELLQIWLATGKFKLCLTSGLYWKNNPWTSRLCSIGTCRLVYKSSSYSIRGLQFRTFANSANAAESSTVALKRSVNETTISKKPQQSLSISGELFASSHSPEQLAIDWWNLYMGSADMVNIRQRTENYYRRSTSRIKIAVLDSGYKKSKLKDDGTLKERIKAERNCLKEGSSIETSINHGDNVLQVLHLAAPDADLYVAKICENRTIGRDERKAIANGIRWAIEQEVDIISMSFGYNSEDDDIALAVRNAHSNGKRVLMFAATANNGLNSNCPYPAQHLEVISISSATGDGQIYLHNIHAQGDTYRFACLGESIAVKAMFQDDAQAVENTLSGTSFATPFAVGIAAFVMGFVAQCADREESKAILLERLHDPQRMRKVLKHMSESIHHYNYLRPWIFFQRPGHRNFEQQEVHWYNLLDDLLMLD